jgi:hypothetical protein
MSNINCTVLSVLIILFGSNAFCSSDGFSKIHCGSDIPKTLIGQIMPNEKVRALERRHKDLGLKDLGASEISENLFSISWLICGQEYMLIEDKHFVVRDVLPIPHHSKNTPEFIGECLVNNKEMLGAIVAILDNDPKEETLSARAAWKIDEKEQRFIKLSTKGLRCPRTGIITRDGGM